MSSQQPKKSEDNSDDDSEHRSESECDIEEQITFAHRPHGTASTVASNSR